MSTKEHPGEERLVRAVGLKEIVALTINGMIGAGIFAVPSHVAALLGPSSPIAFLLAGLFAIILVLCFAELGGRFDRTGGAYLYATEAFGNGVGFVVGWMYFLARLTSTAALANAMVGFLEYFFPMASPVREIFLVSVLTSIGCINSIGIRLSTRVIDVLTISKLTPLLLFIVVGCTVLSPDSFKGITFPDHKPLSEALLIVMFVFTGFEIIAVPGAEILQPRKTVPKGILIGAGITVLLYLCIQIVAVGTYPALATSTSPLADASKIFLGGSGALVLTAGAVLSTFGTLMSLQLVGPRIIYAMALRKQMPRFLQTVHPKFLTPHVAILLFVALAVIVTLSGTFRTLAALSAMARLITYIGSAAALMVLRRKQASPDTFRAPGGVAVPFLSIALSIYLLTAATQQQWVVGIAALAAGLTLYFIARMVDVGKS